jgi:carboxylate-amine ligase
MLDMVRAREAFEASTDFTVGIEEEFQILDPETLDLVQRFEELYEAALQDEGIGDRAAGELISSEIEIRSPKGDSFAEAVGYQRDLRTRLFRLAADRGLRLAATGTHPWSPWQEQHIIDTDHYQRLLHGLGYVARRNNTWSVHVHVGVRGADRAMAVCDRLRPVLPELLAISANSPFLDGADAGLHSARTQIFTKSFPRCGVPEPWRDWATYADFVDLLKRTHSIVEATQLWWSVRPHHSYGTVELRICDAQSTAEESTAIAGLGAACIAQAAIDYDEGVRPEPVPARLIEENLWRAIRYGLDGRMIDIERLEEFPSAALGIDVSLPGQNGAQRQREALGRGMSPREIFSAEVMAAQRSYAGEGVTT